MTDVRLRIASRVAEELRDGDYVNLGIAAATHNSALCSVVQRLWDRGRGEMWKRMEHHFQTPALHAAILDPPSSSTPSAPRR